MKHLLRRVLPVTLIVVFVAAHIASAQDPQALGWELVHELTVTQPTTIAGFLDEDFGITTGLDGATYFTTDGGVTWTRGENNSMCRYGLAVVDAETAWTVGNGGDVRLSRDGGQTWAAVTDVPVPMSYYASFLDDTTGWVADLNTVWFTDDGGQTWEALAVVGEDELLFVGGIALADPEQGYVLDLTGKLHVTADGGANWNVLPLPLNDDLRLDAMAYAALRFTPDGQGTIVTRERGGHVVVMATPDGGETWTTEVLDIEAGSNNAFFLSPDGRLLTISGHSDTMRVFRALAVEEGS